MLLFLQIMEAALAETHSSLAQLSTTVNTVKETAEAAMTKAIKALDNSVPPPYTPQVDRMYSIPMASACGHDALKCLCGCISTCMFL